MIGSFFLYNLIVVCVVFDSKENFQPGMVALICNTSTGEAEEGFGGQLGLNNKTLSQINKQEYFRCEQEWKMNVCECDVCACLQANTSIYT